MTIVSQQERTAYISPAQVQPSENHTYPHLKPPNTLKNLPKTRHVRRRVLRLRLIGQRPIDLRQHRYRYRAMPNCISFGRQHLLDLGPRPGRGAPVAELEALHAVAPVVAVLESVEGADAVLRSPNGEEPVDGGCAVDVACG